MFTCNSILHDCAVFITYIFLLFEPITLFMCLYFLVTPGVNLISTDTTNTIEDESFTFTCIEAGAFPALPIVWNKDATAILSSSRITITSTTAQDESTGVYTVLSVLTISTLVLSDSGTYTCRTSLVPLLNQPVLSPEIMLNVQG